MTIKINKLRQTRPWLYRSVLGLIIVLLVFASLRLAAPYVMRWTAVSWLESQQLAASIVDIEMHLVDGQFMITGVTIRDNDGKGMSLERLGVAWQWKPLFDRQLVVDRITIDNLQLDAAQYQNGDIMLAGLLIPAQPAVVETQVEVTNQPWDISLSQLLFTDFDICYEQFISKTERNMQACIKLDDFNWSGELAVRASEQTTGAAIPVYLQGTTSLSSPSVCYKTFSTGEAVSIDYCGDVTNISWSGDIALSPPGSASGVAALFIEGDFKIRGINLHNRLLGLDLLNIASFDLNKLDIQTLDNIDISAISINKLDALQRNIDAGQPYPYLLGFDELHIDSVHLTSMNDLAINRISLSELTTYISKHEDGATDIDAWLPAGTEQADSKDEPAGATFNYAIGSFEFSSKQHFIYHDDSMKVPFQMDIHDVDIKLTNLDSKQPDAASSLVMNMAIDKHGEFKFETKLTPLASKPTIKGSGTISGFDLRLMAPMTKQFIGQNIRSGQLDADLKINVDKGIIDSNAALSLHQFELKALSKEEAEKLNSEFGFPVSSSLSLLRDRDNTIRLDIPITGDIENPEFNPRDAIVKATSKAITTAVVHYYTPFGLVFAADALFSLATALNFEPMLFDASQSMLTPDHKEQLDKLVQLMQERPGIHLTLCGFSNHTDMLSLYPAQKQQAENTAAKPLTEEQLGALRALAEKRSSVIKDYMVKQQSIKASRLIECTAEYSADGMAGVEISI